MGVEVLRKRNRNLILIITVIILLTIVAMNYTKFNLTKGITATPEALGWMVTNFIPSAEAFHKLPDILSKLGETIFLSIAATTVGAIVALIFTLIGTKNKKSFLAVIVRGFASFSRNIPDAVWAMVFLLSFGQNVLTGFFALFFVSFGVLTRAFFETIEEVGKDSVEGLEATGASYIQIVFQGIIPTSLPQVLSWILYMLETNVRSSTLIGILTGTGVGFAFDLYYKSMNYQVASLVVISIVISVIGIELISNAIRKVIL